MKTKCVIIDDEPLAVDIIESFLTKLEEIEITAKCNSAVEAFDIIRKKNIDLIFLDIEMPELSGLDFLKSLASPPKVIITTAHRKYALEGFELDVVDYLLKPISLDRFLKSIQKFYKSVESGYKFVSGDKKYEDDYLYVKENKKIIKIHLGDILFIESLKDYIIIHTETRKIISKIPISKLEEELPPDKFIRIHRSYIVSIKKIEAFTSYSIEVGKKELVLGRTYKNSVLKTLNYPGLE